jgi:DNA-binding PadR family transcriptional regulator
MGLRQELKRGSTAALVLSLLDERPMYGYEIARELEQRSDGYFRATAASLYPTLHRLEQEGLAQGAWRDGERAETGPRRRYYALTDEGRQALARVRGEWGLFAQRVFPILRPSDT